MTLEQLEAFLAVLDHGSILAASHALGRRRATLQAQVEALEREVGAVLVVRSARGAEVTQVGRAFAQRGRALLAEALSLSRFLDEGPYPLSLRVACQPGLPPNVFALFTRIMRVRRPDTQLEFRLCSPEEANADPEIDLIAQFGDILPNSTSRTFVTHRYPIRLLASPRYLDERGRPSTVEELVGHDLLAWTGHRPERGRWWPQRDGTDFPVHPRTVSNDTHLIRTLACAGLGIALVADAEQVQGTLVGEDLEPVLADEVGEEGRARIVIPERAAELPAVRAFVSLAREFGLGEHEVPAL